MNLIVRLVFLFQAEPAAPQDEPILTLWKTAALPPQIYSDLKAHPQFALYKDGTVIYRADVKKYMKVKLGEKEAKALYEEALEAGLWDIEEEDFPKHEEPPGKCGGFTYTFTICKDRKKTAVILPPWMDRADKLFPENKKMAALKKLMEKLDAYRNDSAKPE
jgi:hypothetical protein